MSESKSPRKLIILKEAAKLFREKGYNASTLRELAKRSGVKGGSIYHHFSSKQDILYQIMDYTMTNLLFRLDEKINLETDPLKKLKEAVKFHIEYHVNETEETFVTDTEIRSLEKKNYNKIIKKRVSYEKKFIEIFNQGNATEDMNIKNVKIAVMAVLQMCTGVSYWYKRDSLYSIDEIADQYISFICWGVSGKV